MIRKDVNKYWVSTTELLKLMGFKETGLEVGNLVMKIDVMGSGNPNLGQQIAGIDVYVEEWTKCADEVAPEVKPAA